ncbi:hypothetical protein BaRGS_00027013 [Batillaria attramentaria]|uniref:Ig-like domain-containing protein n=1 Tax=Batillaria attramentaria TaxID=370345 RepID=A0ABD0K4D4_9CAEN
MTDVHILYFCVFVLFAVPGTSSLDQCAEFKFPTLERQLLVAREYTSITLPFQLLTAACQHQADFRITIAKAQGPLFEQLCDIMLIKGTCHASYKHSGCSCSEKAGEYVLKKVVDRTDKTWTWWTSNGIAKTKAIAVHVIYGARITNLTLTTPQQRPLPIPVPLNDSVDVVCEWENGNPPTEAVLLDTRRQKLQTGLRGKTIRYRFSAVTCEDAGTVYCEAPEATENKSASLVIQSCSDNSRFLPVGAVVGVACFIAVILAVAVAVFVYRKRRHERPSPMDRQHARDVMGLETLDRRRHANVTSVNRESHIYSDISDTSSQATERNADVYRIDYLHPVPTLPTHSEEDEPMGYQRPAGPPAYAGLNPTYEPLRSVYANLQIMRQRLRGLFPRS